MNRIISSQAHLSVNINLLFIRLLFATPNYLLFVYSLVFVSHALDSKSMLCHGMVEIFYQHAILICYTSLSGTIILISLFYRKI